jgi:hypothetical protein
MEQLQRAMVSFAARLSSRGSPLHLYEHDIGALSVRPVRDHEPELAALATVRSPVHPVLTMQRLHALCQAEQTQTRAARQPLRLLERVEQRLHHLLRQAHAAVLHLEAEELRLGRGALQTHAHLHGSLVRVLDGVGEQAQQVLQ